MWSQHDADSNGNSFNAPRYYCSFCLKADFEVKKLCARHGRI
jgi:hypothetical protein